MGSSSPPLPPSFFLQVLWPPDGGAQSLNTVIDIDPEVALGPVFVGPYDFSPRVCPLAVSPSADTGFPSQGCELSFYAGFLSNYQPYLVTVPFLLAGPQLPLSVQKGLGSITDWQLRWSQAFALPNVTFFFKFIVSM